LIVNEDYLLGLSIYEKREIRRPILGLPPSRAGGFRAVGQEPHSQIRKIQKLVGTKRLPERGAGRDPKVSAKRMARGDEDKICKSDCQKTIVGDLELVPIPRLSRPENYGFQDSKRRANRKRILHYRRSEPDVADLEKDGAKISRFSCLQLGSWSEKDWLLQIEVEEHRSRKQKNENHRESEETANNSTDGESDENTREMEERTTGNDLRLHKEERRKAVEEEDSRRLAEQNSGESRRKPKRRVQTRTKKLRQRSLRSNEENSGSEQLLRTYRHQDDYGIPTDRRVRHEKGDSQVGPDGPYDRTDNREIDPVTEEKRSSLIRSMILSSDSATGERPGRDLNPRRSLDRAT